MGVKRTRMAAPLAELKFEMEHPSREIVWARAFQVFGDESKARRWMQTALPVLNHSTPEQCAASEDPERQREVLSVLGAIEFGMFS